MTNVIELAWAAGFFDGEGCTTTSRKNANVSVRLIVMQKDLRPLQRFMNAVGDQGRIYDRGRIHEWATNAEPIARAVLSDLWPYLSAPKREQAERCLKRSTWHNGHKDQLACNDPSHEIVPRRNGGRRCRTCQSAYNKAYKERRTAAVS